MNFENDITACLHVLNEGGLILYPTDTIWGIGCDATNTDAVDRIYKLKKRKEEKAMIVLLADERDVLKWVAQPDLRVFDYLKTAPKPTTVIYDGGIGLAANLMPPEQTVAIRLVKDEFCRHLLKRFRKPIVSTSANISGEPPPSHFAKITGTIKRGVDYTVQWRQAELSPAQPSAVIRWTRQGKPEVLRP